METEIAEEMPGIQLEHNAEPEQMVEDDLSDGLTGGSGIPETSVEPQDPEDHAGQDITGTDTGASDTAAVALLTAKTEKTEAIISNVSGEMFPGGMSLSIEELKKEGLWFVCADMDGTTMYDLDLKGPIGLVIGNEGSGVSRLVREKCDFVASIPTNGDIDSLNASVAAGVLGFEIVRQRMC